MKALNRPLVTASALIVVAILLSWNLLDNNDKTSALPSSLSQKDKLRDAVMDGFTTDDRFSLGTNQPPAAEDVLVQRIRGDNAHLLLMAYYSRENYSGESFTIENGYPITLRDD